MFKKVNVNGIKVAVNGMSFEAKNMVVDIDIDFKSLSDHDISFFMEMLDYVKHERELLKEKEEEKKEWKWTDPDAE